MPCHVIGKEARNEVIGMVIAATKPQGEIHSRLAAGGFKGPGLQLVVKEIIRKPLINQNIAIPALFCDQSTGIMGRPLALIRSQIGFKRLLPPMGSLPDW